ncbi:hypothetical protein VARIO8X_60478 [Burkholderiales bacterium 8X]|nr:hypothetical protein VARIO8X_60478 [Burkholderiales bacterium 8X]
MELCWRKVADEFAPSSFLEDACFQYKNAALINSKVGRVEVDVGYEALAGKWCSKELTVIAQDCANLENKGK